MALWNAGKYLEDAHWNFSTIGSLSAMAAEEILGVCWLIGTSNNSLEPPSSFSTKLNYMV